MTIIIPNEGECVMLDKMINNTYLSSDRNMWLRLYRNDITLSDTTVLADFTEANFTSYTQKAILASLWIPAVTDSGVAKSAYSSEQSWTCGATGGQVCGYYMVTPTNKLCYAEAFGAARSVAEGDIIKITPVFTFRSQITCP